MKISDKIKNLRIELGMTQKQIAQIAGVSDKAVSTWERGLKEPRTGPIQKICNHFGIDIAEFIDEESDYYMEKSDTSYERELDYGFVILNVNGKTSRVKVRSDKIPMIEKMMKAISDEHDPRL